MFDWKLAYAPHCECFNADMRCICDIEKSDCNIIPATVPGNFEIDLMKANLIKDLYYSVNTLDAQKLENMHLWYYTKFNAESSDIYLHFGGIDTYSDIYVNGKLVKSTDNMFIGYDVYADFKKGENEIVVHIKPTCIESRKYNVAVGCHASKYNYPTLYTRKAAHMFGWDIMPRIVSAGIWKDVEIKEKKPDEIKEVFIYTSKIDFESNKAQLQCYINFDAHGDFIYDYSVRVKGECGDSVFFAEEKTWHNSYKFCFNVDNIKLWWPKNSGRQNLYSTTVELLYKGEVCDTYSLNVGIRTVNLDMTDTTDEDGNGEFCFRINGKKIFVLGTNWVPLDAFHSRDKDRLNKALELLDDIGCNMVRCWGGNVYESDEFFDFCDKHGIMVWQDFSMACVIPPQDEVFKAAMTEEAVYQIKRLRNHSSLVLWAGDNEVDMIYIERAGAFSCDPNRNSITRSLLKNILQSHDLTRPYLPSSPYMSEAAYKSNLFTPEDHLWGPRDYFKGEYYKNSKCHFASETGYHGFPSPQSLEKFLENPKKIFEKDFVPTDEYLVHAAGMETDINSPYSYRIKLAYDQVVTLFGHAESDFNDFVKQSQISQAEAKKYFIERFRLSKWRRTGIIWWNLVDGWPQISDAIVDWYYNKKLAYSYIKRSQNPMCFMFDEPKMGYIDFYGVNDLPYDADAEYSVINITENKEVMHGFAHLNADSSSKFGELKIKDNEKSFYLIKWIIDGKEYKNHYYTNIIDIDYNRYMKEIESCNFDEFEGF